ncbi:hypothetical protein [Snuella sedimenti]|uniref:Outer membrane protein beta-barrel domain-containing protein n=1 Tax=Snuella sedimenti TaxID=2798802 RepID=A0A8J7LNC9_9FLAO|nr:hypothetical protein [Snuella sedimenti]MBJ6367753.1 hypothetical protein [Snuella sedimenti]
MKTIFSLLCALLISPLYCSAQETYTVNGEQLLLKTEVKGALSLLSYRNKDQSRFFIKDKSNDIIELIHPRDGGNTYKKTLESLTQGKNMSAQLVGFGRYSLKQFVKAYNSNGHRKYAYTDERVQAQLRIGIYSGVTNHPFIDTPRQVSAALFGAILEVYEKNSAARQSGYISIEQALGNVNMGYASTQFGLGYRFRYIKNSWFNEYLNLQLANFTFSNRTFESSNDENKHEKRASFSVPLVFGLGMDIKVGDTSFITLNYNEIFAVFADYHNSFPVNFIIGYKFNLP